MEVQDQLTKAKSLLEMVMRNYERTASVAESEGYETNYEQDKVLVDLFLEES